MFNRISPSMAVSLVALFVALGGGAYAAAKLPANSVTTTQVKDRSLRAADFRPGQLPAGARGEQGGTGERGAKGDSGAPGARGSDAGSAVLGQVSGLPTSDSNTVQFAYPSGAGNASSSPLEFVAPNRAMVARDLFVRSSRVQTGFRNFTLLVSGVANAVTCRITTVDTCSSTNTVSVPAGATLTVEISSNFRGSGPSTAAFGFRLVDATP